MGEIKIKCRYCISLPGLLAWIQMIFACVVVGLILWNAYKAEDTSALDPTKDNYKNYIKHGEQYTLLVVMICIAVNVVFLLIFFLNCHMGPCVGCRCLTFASIAYGLLALMWLSAGGVEVYAAIKFKEDRDSVTGQVFKTIFNNEYYEEAFRRRAAAAAFCFANGLLYLVSAQQTKYLDL